MSGISPLIAPVLCHAHEREARIAYDRHGYDVELLDAGAVRAYEALVEEHEREAYGLEDELTGELLRRVK
ncbi:hypothetical protein [Streptomyces sp. NPDC054901]